MNPWETQLRKGLVELAVLASLAGGEAYGYAIVERLRAMEGLRFTESTVYPVLSRLAKEGVLSVRSAASPTGPPRRYYQLTTEGRRRLDAMVESWRTVAGSLSTLIEGAIP